MAGNADNPWSGLKNQAKNGVFTIKPDTAPKAAQFVADALAVFDVAAGDFKGPYGDSASAQLKSQYTDMEHVDHFGSLGSGKILSRAFQDVGVELIDKTLPAYKKSLEDLAEAFIIAGHMVKNTEDASQAAFEELKNLKGKGTALHAAAVAGEMMMRKYDPGNGWKWIDADPEMPKWGGGDKYGGPPAIAANGPATQTINTNMEPPEIMTWDNSVAMWYALNEKSNGLVMMGGDWWRMASRLEMAFSTLGSSIDGLTKTEWKGDGADTAKGAVDRLVGTGHQLTVSMRKIGQLLLDGSVWTAVMKAGMPQPGANGEYAIPTIDEENAAVRRAQDTFRNWYKPGVDASSVLPVLPPPTGIQMPKPDPRTTERPGGDGGGTGGNATGSTTAQQAAFKKSQQALADQQKAFDKAQQQAEKDAKARNAEYEKQQKAAEQRYAEQQRIAQQQAQQQAAKQAADQAVQQVHQGMQQGMDAAQKAVEQGMAAAQQAMAKDMQTAGLSGLSGLPSALSALGKDALKAGGGGAGKGGGGAGGGGAGAGAGLTNAAAQSAKLFPRAALTEAAAAAAGRAGLATGAGAPGAPGGMGPAGQGANQGGQKEHKRADYLDSIEHLDEALGAAPVVAKPVVEK
ncbi:hypothetical protein [Nocardia sp. NPDC057440]|uniref:hypothetical protein n=1 Tax=Nocardia sp. NPDC057440 TaxID=3346134 RepID=UPI0036719A4C